MVALPHLAAALYLPAGFLGCALQNHQESDRWPAFQLGQDRTHRQNVAPYGRERRKRLKTLFHAAEAIESRRAVEAARFFPGASAKHVLSCFQTLAGRPESAD